MQTVAGSGFVDELSVFYYRCSLYLLQTALAENSSCYGIATREGNGKMLIHTNKAGDCMINYMKKDGDVEKDTCIDKPNNNGFGKYLSQHVYDKDPYFNKIINTNAPASWVILNRGDGATGSGLRKLLKNDDMYCYPNFGMAHQLICTRIY